MILKIVQYINSSLRLKLLLIFICATIIPLGVLGSISYAKFFSAIKDNTASSTIQIADQLNNNIERLFSDAEEVFNMGDTLSIVEFLSNPNETYNEAKDLLDRMKRYESYNKLNRNINRIYIISRDGKCINNTKGIYHIDSVEDEEEIKTIKENPDKTHFFLGRSLGYGRDKTDNNVLSIGRAVRRVATHDLLGYIIVDVVDISAIEEMSNNLRIGKTGFFIILDGNNQIVYGPRETESNFDDFDSYIDKITSQSDGSFIEKINGKNIFVAFNTSMRTSWKIIGLCALEELVSVAYDIRNMIIVVILMCLIVSIGIYLIVSDAITLPIRDMKEKMQLAASGNLDVRVQSKNRDEIMDLGQSFNKMIEQIKILMENNIKEHENLEKAELKAMQAQINPHFLYNTLDTVVWLAASKRNEQVIEIVEALSGLFRTTLSKGKDWISVRDEIEHVRNYLIIQKKRYADILQFEINVDEAMYDHHILKLTLQPLVENALYHGIKNKRGGGIIKINGAIVDGLKLKFEISDNGVGILPERLDEIISELNNSDLNVTIRDNGFGIYNVQQRLRLFYGKESFLSITSEYGKGTHVTVLIAASR